LRYRKITAHLCQVYDFLASPGLSSSPDETNILGSQVSSSSLYAEERSIERARNRRLMRQRLKAEQQREQ
jgi:hypothetical protein